MFLTSCQQAPRDGDCPALPDGGELRHFVGPMELMWLYGCTVWWNAVEALTLDRIAERMSAWYRSGPVDPPALEPVT